MAKATLDPQTVFEENELVPSWLINGLGYALAVGAGICVSLQQVLNARLRGDLGSPWWAGFASFFVGTLVMLAAVAIARDAPPSGAMIAKTPWPTWMGGVLGAIFVGAAILLVPRFGAATVLALIVLGQMGGSLTLDHFGWLGLAQHPAGLVRFAGACCLILGVVLIRF